MKGIGLDLCEIARMEKLLQDERFLKRFFTESEIDYVRQRGCGAAQSLAGLFAAKEAFGKAIGTGISFDLRELEICHDPNGRPEYTLRGALAERYRGERFLLSISHDGGIAGAVCLWE